MSWISILMILICIMTAINGYRRGFTKTVVSMISFLVVVLLVSILNPLITNVVDTYTNIGEIVEEKCMDIMPLELESEDGLGRNEQIALIEQLPIPESVREDLVENNNNVIYEALGVTGFWGYIVSYLAKMILRAIVFVLSVALAWVIVKIVGLCLNGIAKMPVISLFNKIGGFAIGLVSGLFIIWFLLLIITIFSGSEWGIWILSMVQMDSLANVIYQNNPLVWLLVLFLIM